MQWTIDTMGAYQNTSTSMVLVELENGIPHGPESMFEDDLAMARFVSDRIIPSVEKQLKAVYQQHPEVEPVLTELGIPLPYGPDDLFNLHVADNGIYFIYTFKFPHSYASVQPEPVSVFIPWVELKPFTYEGSILWRIYQN